MIVKVCGVRTPEIAAAAIDAGADWLGLVLVPASPRHVDDAAARAVVDAVRGRADLVGVMVDATPSECEQAVDRYSLSALQLHGSVALSTASLAPVPVIRAINLTPGMSAYIDDWWPDCLVLLDSAPSAQGLPGGTGNRVEQAVAATLARHRRLLLAGGLSAGNVAAAITAVRPHGVDASSGLESTPGVKDAARVVAYVRAARSAAAPSAPGTTAA
ncbi:MAG: phosphoribosylanthranilate isomerase [Candidatus Dormibacteria bacterium]